MPKPSVQPRQMGGFNQGLGNFNEHLDENAMMSAMQQKALAQQSTSSTQSTTGGSALQMQQAAQAAGQAPKPREVSTVAEELIQRPARDIYAGLKSFLDFNSVLGINPEKDDPQTQMRKKQILSNWQKLTQEQQQVAKVHYQESMKKKQQEEQEAQMKKQQAQQHQQVVVPSSPKKGAAGPGGSGKQRAVTKLEQDRKTLSGPASAG